MLIIEQNSLSLFLLFHSLQFFFFLLEMRIYVFNLNSNAEWIYTRQDNLQGLYYEEKENCMQEIFVKLYISKITLLSIDKYIKLYLKSEETTAFFALKSKFPYKAFGIIMLIKICGEIYIEIFFPCLVCT